MTHQASPLVRSLRLAVALLPAAAAVIGPSQLLAQLQPLGAEVIIASDDDFGSCPTVAGRDDGSAVVLRVSGVNGQVRSVAAAPDGSFGADHLLAEGASLRAPAISGVTATARGYVAAWRLPEVWPLPQPQPSLPGAYAGVGLDAAGAATSAPRALGHPRAWLSPRPTGGYAATIRSADRRSIDLQLLSPQGAVIRAPVRVVRTRPRLVAVPEVTLHRPDGESTVLWREVQRDAVPSWDVSVLGTWMRRMSADGRPLGEAVRLLPALAPGLKRYVWAAIGADGTLALVWAEQPRLRPKLRTFTATGTPLGPAVAIAHGTGTVYALAFGARGDVLVLWQAGWYSSSDPPAPIKASLFSRRGEPRAGPTELASGESAGHPRMLCADVASAGSDTNEETWLVAWLASTVPRDGVQILARRFLFDLAGSRE